MAEKRIAFIHPDLGIGGAERLVVDAAVGIQEMNHKVKIYTSHCDKTHCFEEVSNGLLDVQVYGDFLPTNILKKFHILFAILRQLYLTIKLIFSGEINQYDYFIIDQLSFCIPILILFKSPKSKILFYCHFPDQLLSQPQGTLKKIYRIPFDLIEEYSTGLSDKVIVNSSFTKRVFHNTFTHLNDVSTEVIYPCVDLNQGIIETEEDSIAEQDVKSFFKSNKFFISINRFERKKNIDLAIKSFSVFKKKLEQDGIKVIPKLVVAGGFDSRVAENVEYLQELTQLCEKLDLKSYEIRGKLIISPTAVDVLFMPSIKSSIKNALIKQSELLLYTPRNEHFGIVPVESMLFKTPVLGPNNGGPIESIVNFDDNQDEATGFTIELDENKWSDKLYDFHTKFSGELKEKMGNNGFKVVLKKFLRPQMSESFMLNLLDIKDVDKGIIIKIIGTMIQFKSVLLIILMGIFISRFIN